jgi:hypothetical protein
MTESWTERQPDPELKRSRLPLSPKRRINRQLQICVPPLQLPLQQKVSSFASVQEPAPEGTQHQPSAVSQGKSQSSPGAQSWKVKHPKPIGASWHVSVMLSHMKVTHSSDRSAAQVPPGLLSSVHVLAEHHVPGSQSASMTQAPPAALKHSSDPQLGVDEVLAQRPLKHWLLAVQACRLGRTQMVLVSHTAGKVQKGGARAAGLPRTSTGEGAGGREEDNQKGKNREEDQLLGHWCFSNRE